MTYRNPSKEQKEEWKTKGKEQEAKVKTMVEKVVYSFKEDPEKLAELFQFSANFYTYSFNNTMLIYKQNPVATYAQSFDAWKRMGYPVQKGENGLKIFVPVTMTLIKSNDAYIPKSQATKEEKKLYEEKKIPGMEKTYFKIGNVFDIAQTNFPKEKYPELYFVGYPSERHNDICKGLEDFSMLKLNCPVFTSDLSSISLYGTYDLHNHVIRINNRLEDTQKLSTLAHELGHALIHHMKTEKTVSQKELEADAISIMIESNFGLELTDARKRHCANHYKNFENEMVTQAERELKNPKEDSITIFVDKKMDEVFATVSNVYKGHIEEINRCVEKYVSRDEIQRYGANKSLVEGKEKEINPEKNKKKENMYVKQCCQKKSASIEKKDRKNELDLSR